MLIVMSKPETKMAQVSSFLADDNGEEDEFLMLSDPPESGTQRCSLLVQVDAIFEADPSDY